MIGISNYLKHFNLSIFMKIYLLCEFTFDYLLNCLNSLFRVSIVFLLGGRIGSVHMILMSMVTYKNQSRYRYIMNVFNEMYVSYLQNYIIIYSHSNVFIQLHLESVII